MTTLLQNRHGQRKTPRALDGVRGVGGAPRRMLSDNLVATRITSKPVCLDICRWGKVCAFTLNSRLGSFALQLKHGGIHTLFHRVPDLWSWVNELKKLGVKIGMQHILIGRKEYRHLWLLKHVNSVMEIPHAG